MSVKSRILQFQQNTSPTTTTTTGGNSSPSITTANNNFANLVSINGPTSNNNNAVIKHANIATTVVTNRNIESNINNSSHSIKSQSNKPSHFPTLPPITPPNRVTTTSTISNIKVFNNNNTSSSSSSNNNIPRLHTNNHNNINHHQHHQHHDYQHHKISDLRKIDPVLNGKVNTFYGIGVDVSVHSNGKTDQIISGNINNSVSESPTNPPVNRANKPILAQKKASMSINLSSSAGGSQPQQHHQNGQYDNGEKLKVGRSPTRTLSGGSQSSAIPKLNFAANSTTSNGTHTNGSTTLSNGVVMRKSPGSRNASPATTPTRNFNTSVGFSSSSPSYTLTSPTSSNSSSRLYGTMGWKEKYEESEKKRNHLVNLAQKATRDYEELRRRFHDVYADNEKLSRRLDGATTQLDSLRKASEAVYDDYYKLKKRYEAENREKSDALTRVDQYNKENRRLKRQSAAMMMQISDPTTLLEAVSETDSAENDKEILYLRNRVQELENKIVDLDSELEKAKLAEFETQESVMLINDSVNSVKSDNSKLKEQLKQLDEENRKISSNLEDISFEYDSLKGKYSINEEKLILAETELKKILNEKNILQRQSLVFMNDAMDNRLMDALNQIGDLQTTMEEQRNRFEAQLGEIQNQLADRESQMESMEIETASKIRSFEDQVKTLRRRAEDAEQKLEDIPNHQGSPERSLLGTPPPPPPPLPPPMPVMGGPPPPPLPPSLSSGITNGSSTSLNNSLKNAMGTLRRTGGSNSNNSNGGSGSDTPPNGVSGSPQIDDVISQLKKGIKLRPMDKTLSRKPTELPQEKQEDTAVEEMRSILNNLRRTRRV